MEDKMFRENMLQFMKPGEKTLFWPKNSGLSDYVWQLIQEIGGSKPQEVGIKLREVRGEDIPQLVLDSITSDELAYGLTGDDLFDEFMLRNDREPPLQVLNTYDWLDHSAKYYRPALCLMAKVTHPNSFPDLTKVAVNAKYQKTSERALEQLLRKWKKRYQVNVYSGGTEFTVQQGSNDACVDVVFSGKTLETCELYVVDVIRFSDIVLIGEKPPSNPWETEYGKIEGRRQHPADSLTSRLLKDPNEAVKKFGQESAEFIQAYSLQQGLVGEALDVFYAAMVCLASQGIKWEQVEEELQKRW